MRYKHLKEKVKKHFNLKEGIATTMALFAFGGAVWGIQTYLNKNYASAEEVNAVKEEVKATNKRLEWKILKDRLHDIQERIWKWDDRYQQKKMPEEVKEGYRQLEQEKKEVEEELKELKKE